MGRDVPAVGDPCSWRSAVSDNKMCSLRLVPVTDLRSRLLSAGGLMTTGFGVQPVETGFLLLLVFVAVFVGLALSLKVPLSLSFRQLRLRGTKRTQHVAEREQDCSQ